MYKAFACTYYIKNFLAGPPAQVPALPSQTLGNWFFHLFFNILYIRHDTMKSITAIERFWKYSKIHFPRSFSAKCVGSVCVSTEILRSYCASPTWVQGLVIGLPWSRTIFIPYVAKFIYVLGFKNSWYRFQPFWAGRIW